MKNWTITHNRTKIISLMSLIITAIYVLFIFAFNVQPANAYVTIARWQTDFSEYRTYGWVEDEASGPFPASTYDLIDTAAYRWSEASTGKDFSLYDYNDIPGAVRVCADQSSFQYEGWPDWPAKTTLTITGGYVSYAQVYLNSDWDWYTDGTIDEGDRDMDVLTAILHEFGHCVSLNHDSSHTEAVMWPNYTIKRFLASDDKNGIDALY